MEQCIAASPTEDATNFAPHPPTLHYNRAHNPHIFIAVDPSRMHRLRHTTHDTPLTSIASRYFTRRVVSGMSRTQFVSTLIHSRGSSRQHIHLILQTTSPFGPRDPPCRTPPLPDSRISACGLFLCQNRSLLRQDSPGWLLFAPKPEAWPPPQVQDRKSVV